MRSIVEHINRPEWGRGVVVDSRNDAQKLVIFDDGVTRKIGEDYWDKLRPVTLPAEEQAALLARAARIVAAPATPAKKASGARAAAATRSPPVMTFEEQVRQFLVMFPKGFDDERFISEERGRSGATGSEGYKQRAIDDAQELLSAAALEPLLASGAYDEVFKRACAVVKRTENLLFWRTESGPFSRVPAERHEAVARALFALLHGAGPVARRFDALAGALQIEKAGWALPTVFGALFAPGEHYFVRATIADKQARILDVETMRKPLPDGATYERFVEMARALAARLRASDLTPRDLMDVYSFSWRTLHEKSQKAPLES